MKIIKLAKGFFINEIREFNGFFWTFVFPAVLYFILVSVFSGMGSSGISFKMGVLADEELTGLGSILNEVLEQVSPEPFNVINYENMEQMMDDLKFNKIDVGVRIPAGTSSSLTKSIVFHQEPAKIEIYSVSARGESKMALQILKNIFEQVNLQIGKETASRLGNVYKDIEVSAEAVTPSDEWKFSYSNYLFPAVILMAILSISMFNAPIGLIYNRVKGINRRLYTTTIGSFHYFSAFFLFLLFSALLSVSLLYVIGTTLFKVDLAIMKIEFMAKIVYSTAVLFSIGMMISSFCKKYTTAEVIGQIFFQVFMFLGGFYFPVLNFDIPQAVKWFAKALPTTYLVESLRASLGYDVYSFSEATFWTVPSVWLGVSLIVFIFNFKRVMSYE